MKGLFSSKNALPPRRMTNARLGELVSELSDDVQGQLGYWQFNVQNRDVLVITDEHHNRMRIMTCLLYTSPSPRDQRGSRMPSSA